MRDPHPESKKPSPQVFPRGGFFRLVRHGAPLPPRPMKEPRDGGRGGSVHHTGHDTTPTGTAFGAGRRIAGIAVGIDRTCVGIERSVRARTGAVASVCRSGDRGGGARRVRRGMVTAAGAGHRAHQNGGQGQRGETPRRRPLHALNGFHGMTVPFGQGSLLCRFAFFARPPRGHPRGGEPQPRLPMRNTTRGCDPISSVDSSRKASTAGCSEVSLACGSVDSVGGGRGKYEWKNLGLSFR